MAKKKDRKIQMKNKLYEDAGKRIQEMRCEQGYTRSKLAEKAGISDKFLYEIEKGKKGFSSDILFRIANVLEVSCDYILKGEQKKGKNASEFLAVVERFDERELGKLNRLIRTVYDFKK